MNIKELYKNKSVFITDITSDKGVFLSLLLRELGAKIFGMGGSPNDDSIYHKLEVYKFAKVFIIEEFEKNIAPLSIAVNCDYIFNIEPENFKEMENPIKLIDFTLFNSIYLKDVLTLTDKNVQLLNIRTNKNTDLNIIRDIKHHTRELTSIYEDYLFGPNIKSNNLIIGETAGITKFEKANENVPYVLDVLSLALYVMQANYGNYDLSDRKKITNYIENKKLNFILKEKIEIDEITELWYNTLYKAENILETAEYICREVLHA